MDWQVIRAFQNAYILTVSQRTIIVTRDVYLQLKAGKVAAYMQALTSDRMSESSHIWNAVSRLHRRGSLSRESPHDGRCVYIHLVG